MLFRVIMAFPSSSFTQSICSDSIDPILSDCFSIPPSSLPESQPTTPIISEPPPVLERVGTKKNYILWSDMNKALFIQWWLTTTYRARPEAEHPRWGKRGLTSEVWRYFEQGAEVQTGHPCVSCKDCSLILSFSPRNRTNAMLRHRERCLPKGKQRQGNIKAFINTQVREKRKRDRFSAEKPSLRGR